MALLVRTAFLVIFVVLKEQVPLVPSSIYLHCLFFPSPRVLVAMLAFILPLLRIPPSRHQSIRNNIVSPLPKTLLILDQSCISKSPRSNQAHTKLPLHLTGSAGLIVGGVSGVLRDTPALFFATASGLQWFGLGSTFWGTRSFILQQWEWQYRYNVAKDNAVDAASQQLTTPADRVKASTIAGGVAGGGIGLLTRTCFPYLLLPALVMLSYMSSNAQFCP